VALQEITWPYCLCNDAYSSEQLMVHIQRADRVVVRRCKGEGGPNAFEQHMALRLAKVRPHQSGSDPIVLCPNAVGTQSALYALEPRDAEANVLCFAWLRRCTDGWAAPMALACLRRGRRSLTKRTMRTSSSCQTNMSGTTTCQVQPLMSCIPCSGLISRVDNAPSIEHTGAHGMCSPTA
jgi:hypothetical protein